MSKKLISIGFSPIEPPILGENLKIDETKSLLKTEFLRDQEHAYF